METKEERFKRVAEKRVQNILNAIQSLSALSNTKVYKWDKSQLTKIWQAIEFELGHCKESFHDPGSKNFKL